MKVITHTGGRPIKLWVGDMPSPPSPWEGQPNIEPDALKQLINTASLPFVHPKGIAAMPDVHLGMGATIGSVVPTLDAIVPAAVGVDIGCGVIALRTSLKASDLPDSLAELRHSIERGVPTGMNHHSPQSKAAEVNYSYLTDKGIYGESFRLIADTVYGGDWDKGAASVTGQLGTLGGGNHFIEVCLDENQDVWVMLHSGSRGVGNKIGMHFIGLAKRDMERYHIVLPDQDLAYIPEGSPHFDDYVAAVSWAQNFAFQNRQVMMSEVIRNLKHHITKPFEVTEEAINCHHNYIEKEHHFGRNCWVTRKGAIRARLGDLGIIPGSMGQRSFIVRGKGNPDSYHSCSHGAGRAMSRTAARERFTVADLERQTAGVECRKDEGVLDEIPSGYKNIDEVMAQQTDLVEVVHTLKQILCVKGADEGKRRKKKEHQ